MNKAQLIEKCEGLGINSDGTVKELKEKLDNYENVVEDIDTFDNEEVEVEIVEIETIKTEKVIDIKEHFKSKIIEDDKFEIKMDKQDFSGKIADFEYSVGNNNFKYKDGDYRVNGRLVHITEDLLRKRLSDHGKA